MATAPKVVASAHITKDPRVCGGKACIANTRIRVIDIVQLEEEIEAAFAAGDQALQFSESSATAPNS